MQSKAHTPRSETEFTSTLFDAAKASVRAFANSDGIDTAATNAFGPGISGAAVAAAVLDFDHRHWPRLALVAEQVLHGARGAYDQDSDTIYLSREFAAASYGSPNAITAVLVEELGHAIDARVHSVDARGDEGAIFAGYVLGHPPGATELAALKTEDDRGTIDVHGKAVAVEFAAPVVGSMTLDGSLADWSAADQIDKSLSVSGYDIYAKTSGGSYVFALQAPVAIGATTTAWLNTDQNAATGYQIWGFAGGAEYNINFDASGTPHLYTGDAGQTLVSNATVSFGYSADHKIVEFAVPTSAIGSPKAINTLWDVNDNTFLPTDYSQTQYAVIDNSSLPARTDFSRRVGILYSDTSAKNYWDPMAYSQLVMDAQNQAAMAGVHYDILTEADLTNLSKLVNYDALIFPYFANVQSSQVAPIEKTLQTLTQQHHTSLIVAGNFMTNDQNGAALPGDSYERMRTLLDLQPMGGTYPNDVTIRAADVTHPMMQDYAPSELIRSYTGAGWLAYAPVNTAGTDVLATQTVNGRTYDAVIATNTGGDNIHFSTDAVMADNNLLWQAIDYAVNGSGVSVGLQLSRQTSILASRTDMDQAMETMDVSPASGPGIYDKLLPILAQWKAQYNFVGSYFIDVGNNPPEETTSWAKSGTYYKQILAMGNELGSHSVTHPENTNTLSASQIQSEFQGSRQIIEQQMSQILGHPFTVDGAAVPGMPESLSTALSIIQYYDYISGGFSSVGAGYPGAIGYLTPAMASLNKPYIAPNVEFDFSLVEFKGMTAAQAAAEWSKEWTSLNSHAEVPIIVWPWHDYGAAVWSTNPPAPSPYTTSMYTDFIARAYNAGAEFVTLDDLAQRIESLHNSAITTTVSGSTITATVTSPDAGKFALHLDNLGTQKIGHVTGWYAYDNDSILLPRGGGTYTIHLGTAADDVTHLTTLPMRSELLTLTGDGNNLGFSVVGEGDVVIDLKNPAGESMIVTGATYKTLSGDILTLGLGAIAQHDVSVALSFSHAITGDGLANTLIGTSGDDTLSGLGGNDTLIAGAGNDRLDGGAGADAMTGGTGNDTYVVDNASDVVTENPNEGTDTVQSSITYTLPANVENLTLTGNASINGAGNALNNVITGNSGNNVLNGGAGSDTLIGGAGNDTFIYDAADASIQGGAGLDTLKIAGSGVTLDLTLIPDTRITDVEVIDIAGTGNNTVALKLSDVLAMSSTTDTLRIDGNAGDRVTAVDAGSWVHGADQVISANTYHAYSQASALLLVDSHVVTNIV